MSVIIKDLDLPPKCQYCPCCYIENETAVPPNKPSKPICSVWGDSIQDMYNSRNDNCPLIELPKQHGNLIDRQVLLKALQKHWNVEDDDDFANKSVWREIENAPTVIEAED